MLKRSADHSCHCAVSRLVTIPAPTCALAWRGEGQLGAFVGSCFEVGEPLAGQRSGARRRTGCLEEAPTRAQLPTNWFASALATIPCPASALAQRSEGQLDDFLGF